MKIPNEYKQQVVTALLDARKNYGGTDKNFAEKFKVNNAVFSQIKNGKSLDGLVRDSQWLQWGSMLDVAYRRRKWQTVETEVLVKIREEAMFCKEYSKSRILVDDNSIGKTFTGKYLARTVENTFYVDCSQCKTQQVFIRTLAQAIGVESEGRFIDVKAALKQYLQILDKPLIILDEAGDLAYNAFLDLKELWNATEGMCGWYMMGADGLMAYIKRGIKNQRVGFREIFSRYGNKYGRITPTGNEDKTKFYKQLITQVVSANISNKSKTQDIVNRCITRDAEGFIGGLRRAETLLILLDQNQS